MEEDFYLSLLYQELEGRLGPGQAQQLRQWEAASSENRRMAARVREAWARTPAPSPPEVDLDAAFAELQGKMEHPPQAEPQPPRPSRWWVWLAVAAGLVLAGLFAWYSWGGEPVEEVPIAMQTEATTQSLTLPDGSKVVLNAHSQLTYSKPFQAGARQVKLSGEAYFEVRHQPNQPFVVEMANSKVTVLGTQFNVLADANGDAEVYVESGKVKLENAAGNHIILEKGEMARASIQGLAKVGEATGNAMAWRTGVLVFRDSPLQDVLGEISHYYGITFKSIPANMGNCTLTSTFDNEPLADVLEVLQAALGLDIQKDSPGGKVYQVSGDGC